MRPFHLQIRITDEGRSLYIDWFGESALRADGSREFPCLADPTVLIATPFLIDLTPLLAEVVTGTIDDAEAVQAADEFLLLRDLLSGDDFEALCLDLYHFLWRQAETQPVLEGMRRHTDGRVWVDPDRRLVRVWFGTDRRPVDTDGPLSFDAGSSGAITYGVCNVFIPESHKPGSTGTAWWRRWIRLQADDTLAVHEIYGLPRDVFWSGLANKLADWWKPGERNLFVLIHGFNVDFEEAAIRAAQLGYDLKLPGEIAFYSWPSQGNIPGYPADEATITASVPHIAEFLHELSERSGAERLHLFVHSMGNRGFLSALERLVARNLPQLRLGQVFFCAPDEDIRTFKDKATAFPHQFENRTLLVSPDDKAVWTSKKIRRLARVGHVPPVLSLPDMDTIEVEGFGLLELGHGYFASARPVIEDIRDAIETRKPAHGRKIPRDLGRHFFIRV